MSEGHDDDLRLDVPPSGDEIGLGMRADDGLIEGMSPGGIGMPPQAPSVSDPTPPAASPPQPTDAGVSARPQAKGEPGRP